MNAKEMQLYRELRDERDNHNGWFHTLSSSWPPEKTAQEIDLANRVLAEYERSQRAKREYVMYFQEERRANELLSKIPDAEETFWSLEMREHTRIVYRSKRKIACWPDNRHARKRRRNYVSSSDVGPARSLRSRYYNL